MRSLLTFPGSEELFLLSKRHSCHQAHLLSAVITCTGAHNCSQIALLGSASHPVLVCFPSDVALATSGSNFLLATLPLQRASNRRSSRSLHRSRKQERRLRPQPTIAPGAAAAAPVPPACRWAFSPAAAAATSAQGALRGVPAATGENGTCTSTRRRQITLGRRTHPTA